MALTTESPRCSLRTASFSDVERTLDEIGHVVLDEAWNYRYLEALHTRAKSKFEADDALYDGRFDQFPASLIEQYLGGHTNLDEIVAAAAHDDRLASIKAADNEFFFEFERSGLPALLRHLLNGNFILGRSERVIRRADPRFEVRFTGLHQDGQLRYCSSRGVNSRREFTIWTPLQPCVGDDTPRLLLLHRREQRLEIDGDIHKITLLKQEQVRDERTYLTEIGSIDEQFDRIYRRYQCFAPRIPIGSVVLFEHCVQHGSYRTSTMKTPRYSVDCRAVGEYRKTKENAGYGGVMFSSATYPSPTLKEHAMNLARVQLHSYVGKVARARLREIYQTVARPNKKTR
jgi:hypothetical protein